MRSTLKDIAHALGVSTTTVSWVLSGQSRKKGISQATEELVMKCAQELNYQPNLLARSLQGGASGTIGLVVPSIGDLFYSSLARAMEAEAEKLGYTLMVCSSESDGARESRMIDVLRAKQVDGILMAPLKLSNARIISMLEDRFPFVLVDRYYPELQTNYVIFDNEDSSFKLVSHLISKGYRKIAVVTTNSYLYSMTMRHKGYVEAHRAAGLEPDPELYGEVKYHNYVMGSQQELISVLDTILERRPDVEAFFFTTHVLTSLLFTYCSMRNIKPDDFGIASIHEEPFYTMLAPRINVAMIPIAPMGYEAVRILQREIRATESKKTFKGSKTGLTLSCNVIFRE
ncbi:LacI family transcriptional regulator [Bacteroidia bacterium]|nr:LacI family transcriptional regulator [Bacteroidia bacterium]